MSRCTWRAKRRRRAKARKRRRAKEDDAPYRRDYQGKFGVWWKRKPLDPRYFG